MIRNLYSFDDFILFTKAEHPAIEMYKKLGLAKEGVDLDEFKMGFDVELEHGPQDPETDVTHGCPLKTAKIAWAHLKEDPKYYTKLKKYVED